MRLKAGILAVLAATFLASTMAVAAEEPSEQVKRMDAAATVLDEIMGTPDKGIPQELLDSAKCVAVIPSMVKIGFVFGGRHGKGLATCRTTSGWSAPAPFSVTGGSWGLQIGGEAVDVVMLVMNDNGMERMLSSKFKIGADASAAAGPVGRHVEGDNRLEDARRSTYVFACSWRVCWRYGERRIHHARQRRNPHSIRTDDPVSSDPQGASESSGRFA